MGLLSLRFQLLVFIGCIAVQSMLGVEPVHVQDAGDPDAEQCTDLTYCVFVLHLHLSAGTDSLPYCLLVVYVSEMIVDWIKHMSIVNYTGHPPDLYRRFVRQLGTRLLSTPSSSLLTDASFPAAHSMGRSCYSLLQWSNSRSR